MKLAKFFGHDFDNKWFELCNSNGHEVYYENSDGFWSKREYDTNDNRIYYEDSDGNWYKKEFDPNNNEVYYETSNDFWCKREFDSNGNRIYYEDSNGIIVDNRPKSCEGKMVEIDGVKYKLTEV